MNQRLAPAADTLPPRLARRFWMAFGASFGSGRGETHLDGDDAATHDPEDGNELPVGALLVGGWRSRHAHAHAGAPAAGGGPSTSRRWLRAVRNASPEAVLDDLLAEPSDTGLLAEQPEPPRLSEVRALAGLGPERELLWPWRELSAGVERYRQARDRVCGEDGGLLFPRDSASEDELRGLGLQLRDLDRMRAALGVHLRAGAPSAERAGIDLLLGQMARYLRVERQKVARIERALDRRQAARAAS